MYCKSKSILIGLVLFKFWFNLINQINLVYANKSSTSLQKELNLKNLVNLVEHNKTSRFREEDDYEDNEGINGEQDEDGLSDEGADQEDGDDDGGDDEGGGDDSGDDDSGGEEGGGDDSGGDDEPADEPDEGADEPGAGSPSESPPEAPGVPGEGPGDSCPTDTVFSTANAWRVRLLSQICQLSNYLLSGFHFKYKFIIKKLQHLISLLSYNQSNMNLEEMVRFLTNIQSTYNQILSGYVGVFYIIKKCQYKEMCFDCAVVTGQLQKLMMETNYTIRASNDLSVINLSNRTINYLKNKMNEKLNHTKKLTKPNHLKPIKRPIIKTEFNQTILSATNQSPLNGTNFNLTQMLKINQKLHKHFNKLIRLDKKKHKIKTKEKQIKTKKSL